MKCKMLLYSDIASPAFLPHPERSGEKPPASEQFNWTSCAYDVLPVLPEQLELDLSLRDGAILPDDRTVTLLAIACSWIWTLYIGKKAKELS